MNHILLGLCILFFGISLFAHSQEINKVPCKTSNIVLFIVIIMMFVLSGMLFMSN